MPFASRKRYTLQSEVDLREERERLMALAKTGDYAATYKLSKAPHFMRIIPKAEWPEEYK